MLKRDGGDLPARDAAGNHAGADRRAAAPSQRPADRSAEVNRTINKTLIRLGQILDTAVRYGRLKYNPDPAGSSCT